MKKMKSNRIWTAVIVSVVSLTRIGSGLFSSLSGPTLLYLAENVNSSVSSVSYIFTGRAAGFFIGSVGCGALIRLYKNYKPLLSVGLGVVLSGILMLIVPWIHNLAALVVISSITGLLFGYLDAGIQSLYLSLWGEKESRPYLQSFHFAFAIGAVLAPIIANPFLEMAEADATTETTCPQSQSNDGILSTTHLMVTESSNTNMTQNFNPVGWTYVISGSFTILTGAAMVYLALVKAELKCKKKLDKEASKEAVEEPLKDVIWLFLPIIFYYCFVVGLELIYQSYIYSIALCSSLAFTVTDAAWLNTVFWIGFLIGRLAGILFSTFFQPTLLILYDLVGTCIAMIIFEIFGSYIPLLVWFISFFHGFFVATLYPSGISWSSTVTKVSSTYIFIFAIGNTIGSMALPAIAGEIFEKNPFNVVHLLVGMAVINIPIVFWMLVIGKRHIQLRDTPSDLVFLERF